MPHVLQQTGAQRKAVLFEGDQIRIVENRISSECFALTFDHWVEGRSQYDNFQPRAWIHREGFTELRVQTKANDWYLNGDLLPTLGVLRSHLADARKAVAIGFSMGGFAAALFGALLSADWLVLISPQFGPPNAKVNLTRSEQALACRPPDLECLTVEHSRSLPGVVLFDPVIERDHRHALAIASKFPHIMPVSLPYGGHPAVRLIRLSGNFDSVQRLLFDGAPAISQVVELHDRIPKHEAEARRFPASPKNRNLTNLARHNVWGS